MTTLDEADRVTNLLDAQSKAQQLFDEAMARGLVQPGISDATISDSFRDLANEMFGVRRYWHKRLVRSGENTLAPYKENPPDRTVGENDIMILDFGPIFAGWEADLGRTLVFGDDPQKLRLQADVERIWDAGREHFDSTPDIRADEMYEHMVGLIREAGYEHDLGFAGHLVGEFPHEALNFPESGATQEEIECYISPGNALPLRRSDRHGRQCHWILEVWAKHPENGYAAFKEQLLDL